MSTKDHSSATALRMFTQMSLRSCPVTVSSSTTSVAAAMKAA